LRHQRRILQQVKITTSVFVISISLVGCGEQATLLCTGTDTFIKEPGSSYTTKPRVFSLFRGTYNEGLMFTVDNIDFLRVNKNEMVYSGTKENAEFTLSRESGHLRLITVQDYLTYKEKRSFEGVCKRGERVN